MCSSICKRVHRVNYMFEMLTGLYMLDAWEKVVFNLVVVGVLGAGAFFIFSNTPAAIKSLI
jgi:hypothetical protein